MKTAQNGDEWAATFPSRFTPPEKVPPVTIRWVGWVQGQSGRGGE
jgi:hypothetical protein